MKAILRPTIKTLLAVSIIGQAPPAWSAQPLESGAGKVCGTLRSFDGETQVFDYTRTHLGDASFGTKLHCGDWVSVDKGKAVLEHVAGAGILVAENTFVQVLDPQSGDNPEHAHLALYRGEFLAQPEKAGIRIVTPNAVARVEKGGAFVVYSGASEESQIVGLGGKASLENRFFAEPRMEAGFAKVVTFANPIERLLPDQARFVNPRDLGERLARLGVPKAILESVEKAVKAGAKTRMPVTLAVTRKPEAKESIQVHAGGELAGAKPEIHPGRALASVGAAIAAKRGPRAGVSRRSSAEEPNFALKRQDRDEAEKKRLLQALSSMRPDDENP